MAQPLTDAIEALTTYANTVTGASDTTLSEAVATLASGYGGGISIDGIATNTEPSGAIVLSDSVTTIANYSFYERPITSISGVGVTSIGSSALQGTLITSITDENFPNLGVHSRYTLVLSCNSLQHIKLTGSLVALNGNYVLRNCTGLITAEFPNAAKSVGASYVGMSQQAFQGCTNLVLADVGHVHSVANSAFNGDSYFETLIIRYTSVATLSNINAFNGTPFASNGTGGTLYVPSSLVTQYSQANNWSTILGYANNSIKAIEGSIYE